MIKTKLKTQPTKSKKRAITRHKTITPRQLSFSTTTTHSTSQLKPVTSPSTSQPSHIKKFTYNTAAPTLQIPEKGELIFETSLRAWHRTAAPMFALTGSIPVICAATVALVPLSPALLAACTAFTASSLFGAIKLFKFSQSHVETIRLMQNNLLQFDTVGVFGFRRTVQYPANYVFPLVVDPSPAMFGISIDLLPLPQDMAQQPGTVMRKKSGLAITPDSNVITGAPKEVWDLLCNGDGVFEESEKPLSKRKVASFAV